MPVYAVCAKEGWDFFSLAALQRKGERSLFSLPSGKWQLRPYAANWLPEDYEFPTVDVMAGSNILLDVSEAMARLAELRVTVTDARGVTIADYILGMKREGLRLYKSVRGAEHREVARIVCEPGDWELLLRYQDGSVAQRKKLRLEPGLQRVRISYPDQ